MGLSSQDLIKAGIKPGQTFGKCLKCATIEEALALWNASQESKPKAEKKDVDWSGTAFEWLCTNPCFQNFASRETPGTHASKSEKKRWLESGSVLIDGKKIGPHDEVPDEFSEIVFFPNGRRVTMPGNRS